VFFGEMRAVSRVSMHSNGCRIERHALRARVEIGAALRAPRLEPDVGRHGIAALRAAHDLAEARHVEVLRASCEMRRARRAHPAQVVFAAWASARARVDRPVAALPVLPFVAHRRDCPSLILFHNCGTSLVGHFEKVSV